MKSFFRLLVLIFSLQLLTFVSAFAETCERVLQPEHFELDERTISDLGLHDLVAPVIGQYIQTDLGRAELKKQLQRPLLSSEAIRSRQQAVQILIENSELRQALKMQLAGIHKNRADEMPELLNELADRHKKSSKHFNFFSTPLSAGVLATLATEAAHDPSVLQVIPSIGMMYLMFGGKNMESVSFSRYRMHKLRPLFAVSDDNYELLQGLSSPYAQDLGRALSAARDPQHKHSLSTVNKKVRRMQTRVTEVLGELTFLVNFNTYHLREKIIERRESLDLLLEAIGQLDVLVGLAELVVQSNGQYVFPEILDENHSTHLETVNGHHPYVLKNDDHSTSNSIQLEGHSADGAPSFLLLTGPNTGGKSTYIRMASVLSVLAQIGAPVPAESMKLTPLALMTNISIQDNLAKGQSSFHAQGQRVASLLKRAESYRHVFLVMDEILTGTSPEEHRAAERSIIRFVVKRGYISILATHDRELQKLEDTMSSLANIHVDDKAHDTFAVKAGPSTHRNAIQVLREVGMPAEITDEADQYLKTEYGL